jgi:hypothetical protein
MSSPTVESYGEFVPGSADADREWPLAKIIFVTAMVLAYASLVVCYAYPIYVHIVG